MASVISMFEAILLSLECGMVIVMVVDILRFFAQSSETCHGAKDMVSRLVSLYRNPPAETFKVLFASPTRSKFVEELFGNEEILELPRDIPSAVIKSPARKSDVFEE
jgi:hypothetical protein